MHIAMIPFAIDFYMDHNAPTIYRWPSYIEAFQHRTPERHRAPLRTQTRVKLQNVKRAKAEALTPSISLCL